MMKLMSGWLRWQPPATARWPGSAAISLTVRCVETCRCQTAHRPPAPHLPGHSLRPGARALLRPLAPMHPGLRRRQLQATRHLTLPCLEKTPWGPRRQAWLPHWQRHRPPLRTWPAPHPAPAAAPRANPQAAPRPPSWWLLADATVRPAYTTYF